MDGTSQAGIQNYFGMKKLARFGLVVFLRIDEILTRCINKAAIYYGEGLHVKHRLMQYHDFFVQRVRPGEYVLDVGCGIGAVAYSIASRAGGVVTGVDINEGNIKVACSRYQHPSLKYIVGDVVFDLPAIPCDVVILSNILEHIEKRQVFLESLKCKLNPKRVLVRVPMINRDWRVFLRRELGLFYFSDPTHYTEYTEESFKEEMKASGLAIVECTIKWGEIWSEVRPDG